jgi:hypothetical protein
MFGTGSASYIFYPIGARNENKCSEILSVIRKIKSYFAGMRGGGGTVKKKIPTVPIRYT